MTQARDRPELAPGGGGDPALAMQLAAGLALTAAAVHVAQRRELALAGALLVAAMGLALHALPAPPHGAALFTLALVGAGVAPAAAAHAALLHPGGRPHARLDRAAAAIGYAVHVGLLGLLPALVFDPRGSGCFACPHNLLLMHADPRTAAGLARWGLRAAAGTETALVALVLIRLLRRSASARTLAGPVSVAACATLAVAVVANLRAAGGLARTATDRDLWLATVVALGLLAAGLAWRPLRAARMRAALGRLSIARVASTDDILGTVGRALGDPGVTFVLPHPETGEPIARDGAPAATVAPPGRTRTPVERRGRIVAWLEHRAELAGAADLPAATARTAGLTLEREALRVAERLQEGELRASTLRLVAAGDTERRRLERDLHDSAQQRLLALSLGLTRARSAARPAEALCLTEVETRLAAVRDDLRRIAHGIHSVTLAEGGLAEAVLALVQSMGGGVTIDALPGQRVSAEAEAAAYRVIAASLRLGRGPIRVAIHAHGGELDVTLSLSDVDAAVLANALDHAGARVAALGGSLTVLPGGTGAIARARIPAPA